MLFGGAGRSFSAINFSLLTSQLKNNISTPQKSGYGNRSPPIPDLHLTFAAEANSTCSASSPTSAPLDVRIYETAVSLVDEVVARSKVASDSVLDVCSPKFDPRSVKEKIDVLGQGRIVADVLLDQKVLLRG